MGARFEGALDGPHPKISSWVQPRTKEWTDEFQRFKSQNSEGVRWPIDAEGEQSVEDLIRLCQQRGIQLIFVYSPEYIEMQKLTKNRAEVFERFGRLAGSLSFPPLGLQWLEMRETRNTSRTPST